MNQSEKDALNLGNAKNTAQGAFVLLDAAQNIEPRYEQVRSVAATLKLMCDKSGLDARYELERAERLIYDGDRALRPEFSAIRDYSSNELGGR